MFLSVNEHNQSNQLRRQMQLASMHRCNYQKRLLHQEQHRLPEAELAFKHALDLDPDGQYGGLALKALGALTPGSQ